MELRVHALLTGELESMLSVSLLSSWAHPDIPLEKILPYGYRNDIVRPSGSIAEGSMVPCWAWYIEGAEKKILIDTGMGSAEEVIATQSKYGADLAAVKKTEWDIVHQLQRFGLSPNDIDIVVQTHLHFDHVGNNELFDRAIFVTQRDEIPWGISPPPYGVYYYREFAPHVVGTLNRTMTIDGDWQICPGVQLVKVGGHSPGLQFVLVDTGVGKVAIASDAAYNYRNLEYDWPMGPYYRLDDVVKGFQLMKREADIVVPQHDYYFL